MSKTTSKQQKIQKTPADHGQVKKLKSIKRYLDDLKTPWGVVVFDENTGRRATGQTLSEALQKFMARGSAPQPPLVVSRRTYERLVGGHRSW